MHNDTTPSPANFCRSAGQPAAPHAGPRFAFCFQDTVNTVNLAMDGCQGMITGMDRRFAFFAAPLALLLTAAAPHRVVHAPPPAPASKPLGDAVRVSLNTTLGPIVVEVDVKHAPITAANFVRYVDQRRFDGIVFYRAMHLAWGDQPNGLVQAGTQGDPKRILKPIAHEPTSQTGLLHKAGSLSMARFAPGTATGDFSILVSDQPGLDADPKGTTPDAQAGFAVFGHVVEGMDVARKIWDAPLSPTQGQGVLKGQMLAAPVRIVTARRVAMQGAAVLLLPPVMQEVSDRMRA